MPVLKILPNAAQDVLLQARLQVEVVFAVLALGESVAEELTDQDTAGNLVELRLNVEHLDDGLELEAAFAAIVGFAVDGLSERLFQQGRLPATPTQFSGRLDIVSYVGGDGLRVVSGWMRRECFCSNRLCLVLLCFAARNKFGGNRNGASSSSSSPVIFGVAK